MAMKYKMPHLLFSSATYKVLYCNCAPIKFTYSEPPKFISMNLNVYGHYQHTPRNVGFRGKCINKQCTGGKNHNDLNNTTHNRTF